MQTPERVERLRSPFAAAFFSAIQPGLGQMYGGAVVRGLLWAAPSILFYAFTAGVIRSMGLTDFATQFTSDVWLNGLLVGLAIDFLYRGASAVDAFRVTTRRQPRTRSITATVSVAGLVSVILVLVLAHVSLGQTVFAAIDFSNTIHEGDQGAIATIDPSFRPSTPEPGVATPTIAPGETAAPPTDTPGPTPSTAPYNPDNPNARLNILLIGADAGRYNVQEYLTDTMIVASIDPQTGRVALISLPRDTVGVPFPKDWGAYSAYGGSYGCGACKINTLYTTARGSPSLFPGNDQQRGYDALKGALGQLYGIDIPYYVAIDLDGFRDIINTLGGVIVDVQVPVYDAKYPANEGKGSTKLYIPPGIQFMDGSEALAFARARHTTSDFDRAARQQRVLTSVREQTDLSTLLAPGVITQLFNDLKQDVRTDIPQSMFPQLIGLAQKVDFNNRISLVLTPPTYSRQCYSPAGTPIAPGCPNNNYYELVANVSAIRNAVHNVFDTNPAVERQREQVTAEAATVSVLNGTPSNNTLTTRVSEVLTTYGINAVVPPVNSGFADRRDYTDTVVTAWNGADQDMSTTMSVLGKLFGVQPTTGTDPNQTANFTVDVGTNTQVPQKSP